MSERAIKDVIKEEIKYVPCFHCIDGFLRLVKLKILDEIKVKVYCTSCGKEDEMQFNL